MKLVWHIVRKDFRRLRLYLAGWLGLVILMLIVTGIGPHLQERTQVLLFFMGPLLPVAKIFLVALIVSSLVQNDTPVGSTAFWLSRPVSGGTLLVSKTLFLVVTLILPTVAVEAIFLCFHGVTGHDLLRSLPDGLFWQLLTIAVFMIPASLTRNLPRMFLLGFLFFVASVCSYGMVSLVLRYYRYERGFFPPLTLQTSSWIGLCLCFLVVAGAIIGHQYVTRRTRISLILVFLGMFLCCVSGQLWTWDFVALAQRLDKGILDPGQVTARIDEQSLSFRREGYRTVRRHKQLVLHGKILVGSPPPGLVVIPERIVSHASFWPKNKPYIDEHRNPYVRVEVPRWADGIEPSVHQGRVETLSGYLGAVRFLDAERHAVAEYHPVLMEIWDDKYESHASSSAVLSADVDFVVQQDVITSIRLEPGAHYDRGSDHAEILQVATSSSGVTIQLKESRHRLVHDHGKSRRYVLHNPSKREALLGDEYSISPLDFSMWSLLPPMAYFPPVLKVSLSTLSFESPGDSPVDSDWFGNAELVRIETMTLGRFSKSIRLDDFVMKRIPQL